MMKFLVVIITLFKISLCVPPRPLDGLQEDIEEFKKNIKTFSTQMEKWNSLYTNQLEPRIVSSATLLSSIDSNINNLQERAHVWDTFQLHVSAWNDQLSSLDRKMDIISEGQKKLFALDAKINAIASMEYKLEAILKKLEETNEAVNTINTKMLIQNQSHDSLFEEFTTRGVLSTLKLMERKMDKIQFLTQNTLGKNNVEDGKSKTNLHCKIQTNFEEILKDISSKVDIIFDKTSSKDYKDETASEEYQEEQQSAEITSREIKIDPDTRLFKKIIKRITQPCKQTNSLLEKIQNKLVYLENHVTKSTQNEETNTYRYCPTISSNISDFLSENVNKILHSLNTTEKLRDNVIGSYFIEQRAHFERTLKTYLEKECTNIQLLPTIEITQTFDFADENVNKCDILNSQTSGVYKLGKHDNINPDYRNYFIRFCEIVGDKKWTVIQRRLGDDQNFNLTWTEYKNGFGNLRKSFWFGNEFIHRLSKENYLQLRIELEDFDGNKVWAEYDKFEVKSEDENYKLIIGNYRGNASDSFTSHNNSYFSTFDKKNDQAPDCCPCAVSYGGGWWFNSCFESNLNGVYQKQQNNNDYYGGIIWENWLGNYSLKMSKMMVKIKETHQDSAEITNVPETTITIPFYEDP